MRSTKCATAGTLSRWRLHGLALSCLPPPRALLRDLRQLLCPLRLSKALRGQVFSLLALLLQIAKTAARPAAYCCASYAAQKHSRGQVLSLLALLVYTSTSSGYGCASYACESLSKGL